VAAAICCRLIDQRARRPFLLLPNCIVLLLCNCTS
jgi:hypothetical protein